MSTTTAHFSAYMRHNTGKARQIAFPNEPYGPVMHWVPNVIIKEFVMTDGSDGRKPGPCSFRVPTWWARHANVMGFATK